MATQTTSSTITQDRRGAPRYKAPISSAAAPTLIVVPKDCDGLRKTSGEAPRPPTNFQIATRWTIVVSATASGAVHQAPLTWRASAATARTSPMMIGANHSLNSTKRGSIPVICAADARCASANQWYCIVSPATCGICGGTERPSSCTMLRCQNMSW